MVKSFLIVILSFFIIFESYGQGNDLSLKSLMGSNQILIIGESYGQPESAQFLTEKVKEFIGAGACLKVGLEIPSDQQEVLQSAMSGEVSMSDVLIDNVIDHDNYREMMVGFSEEIKQGKCLSVYAINPPSSMPISSDAMMEQEVVKLIDDKPMVLLVGNKHAVMDYKSLDGESALLAQRLRTRSIGVSSILQHWKPAGYCVSKTATLYSTSTDKKSKVYVKEAIGELSAEIPEKVSMVADGVIVWGCESVKIKEVDTKEGNVVKKKLTIDVSQYEIVERDQEVLDKIRWGIKHEYPVLGMNKDETREALGEPNEIERAGQVSQWIYRCSDDDGFDYDCYILRFIDDSLVKFDDLE